MNSILQGTTPSLTISIDPDDLLLSNVAELELAFQQFNQKPLLKHFHDCVLNTEENTITYHFTQEETLAFLPSSPLNWQLRFATVYGDVIGTNVAQIQISDLISNEVLG